MIDYDVINEHWNDIETVADIMTKKYFKFVNKSYGNTDDLRQDLYEVFITNAHKWDPSRSSFRTYLNWLTLTAVHNVFIKTCSQWKGENGYKRNQYGQTYFDKLYLSDIININNDDNGSIEMVSPIYNNNGTDIDTKIVLDAIKVFVNSDTFVNAVYRIKHDRRASTALQEMFTRMLDGEKNVMNKICKKYKMKKPRLRVKFKQGLDYLQVHINKIIRNYIIS